MTAGEKRSGAFCAPGAGRGGGRFLGLKFPGCDAAAARGEPCKGGERGRRSVRFRAALPFRDKERGPSPCGLGPTEKVLSLPPRSVRL